MLLNLDGTCLTVFTRQLRRSASFKVVSLVSAELSAANASTSAQNEVLLFCDCSPALSKGTHASPASANTAHLRLLKSVFENIELLAECLCSPLNFLFANCKHVTTKYLVWFTARQLCLLHGQVRIFSCNSRSWNKRHCKGFSLKQDFVGNNFLLLRKSGLMSHPFTLWKRFFAKVKEELSMVAGVLLFVSMDEVESNYLFWNLVFSFWQLINPSLFRKRSLSIQLFVNWFCYLFFQFWTRLRILVRQICHLRKLDYPQWFEVFVKIGLLIERS